MTDSATLSAGSGAEIDRRAEPREPNLAELWMVDHQGETILKCRCVETSKCGMRLRVPLGYGVAEGQRYELRSNVPGRSGWFMPQLIDSRWATVVRTHFLPEGEPDYLDVGVVLDLRETAAATSTHA